MPRAIATRRLEEAAKGAGGEDEAFSLGKSRETGNLGDGRGKGRGRMGTGEQRWGSKEAVSGWAR